ncbi:hypothetical protein ABB25_04500 [Stenotrophomonas koreensis]|uniref:Uncharacterized protein n=1 Tax=Stenotrophomonas koreensis TaxID=266128 RepID=A0A0R0BRL4_9GAMM|nr:hypothetical protein ABB25_04500 [Stenotrophomonas koreensis]
MQYLAQQLALRVAGWLAPDADGIPLVSSDLDVASHRGRDHDCAPTLSVCENKIFVYQWSAVAVAIGSDGFKFPFHHL